MRSVWRVVVGVKKGREIIMESKSLMQEHDKTVESPEVVKLSHELTYRRYLMNRDQARNFYKEISVSEYIALHNIQQTGETMDIYSGRTYLKDLADKMQLSIRKTSKMIGKLRDRGLVVWSHDGNGSEGTYVTITDSGKKLLNQQEEVLKEYYGRVIQKYGKENLIQLLQLMKQLETVMSSEMEGMEEMADDGADE